VDDLRLTREEFELAQGACRWVRMSPGLLPLLSRFLAVRLAFRPTLANRLAGMDAHRVLRLWVRLKAGQWKQTLPGRR
jgi:hypothetical protein